MKIKLTPLYLAFVLLTTHYLPARAESEAIKTVVITANDNMKFNLARINVTPGQRIRIQLKNEGTLPKEVMAHNWILLKAGLDPNAYTTQALTAKNEGYQPKALADEVLASIPLIGARETGEVTFDAPTVPGSYPYFCSFPAHCQVGMRGELIVK